MDSCPPRHYCSAGRCFLLCCLLASVDNSYDKEGTDVAAAFNQAGLDAFVLKYDVTMVLLFVHVTCMQS